MCITASSQWRRRVKFVFQATMDGTDFTMSLKHIDFDEGWPTCQEKGMIRARVELCLFNESPLEEIGVSDATVKWNGRHWTRETGLEGWTSSTLSRVAYTAEASIGYWIFSVCMHMADRRWPPAYGKYPDYKCTHSSLGKATLDITEQSQRPQGTNPELHRRRSEVSTLGRVVHTDLHWHSREYRTFYFTVWVQLSEETQIGYL